MSTVPDPPRPNRDDVVVLDDGRKLGFAEFGDPDGDPVLWFHGTPGARQQLPPDVGDAGRERGLRIIGMERPGTGESTPYLYDVVIEYAADVAQFADRLGLERYAVVGLSGGGPYVLACAHQLPDRIPVGIVLGGIGPTRGHEAAPGYTRLLPFLEPMLTVLREPLANALTAAIRPAGKYASPGYDLYARFGPRTDRPLLQQPDFKAMFIHDLLTAMEGGLRAPIYDLLLFSRPWGFSLRQIRIPVRFWQGDADLVVPPSHGPHQAALVPDSSFTSVPGEGHFAGFVNVEEVLDAIRECWPRAASPRTGSSRTSAPRGKAAGRKAPARKKAAKKATRKKTATRKKAATKKVARKKTAKKKNSARKKTARKKASPTRRRR